MKDRFGNTLTATTENNETTITIQTKDGATHHPIIVRGGVMYISGTYHYERDQDAYWLPETIIRGATKFRYVCIVDRNNYVIPNGYILENGYGGANSGEGYAKRTYLKFNTVQQFAEVVRPTQRFTPFDVSEIKAYFDKNGYPEGEWKLLPWVTIPDVRLFVETSLRLLNGNDGSQRYEETYKHLTELHTQILKSK